MSRLLLCVTLAVVVALAVADKPSHHWSLGEKRASDHLLVQEIVREPSLFLRKNIQEYTYPKVGRFAEEIHFINCTDQYQDGNGGYVTLNQGGIDQHFVNLRIKSQRGHGFHFIIEIFGNLPGRG